ncbi:MAG: hypothetical protein WBY94_13530, partial [Polyangiaceae bacterium]
MASHENGIRNLPEGTERHLVVHAVAHARSARHGFEVVNVPPRPIRPPELDIDELPPDVEGLDE